MFDAIAQVWRIAPALMQVMPEIKQSVKELQDVLREGEQAIKQLRRTVEAVNKALNNQEFEPAAEVIAKRTLLGSEAVTPQEQEQVVSMLSPEEKRFFERGSGDAR